jgi:ubiquinone/menaquinone biosynthesis C-methylase UbiE
VSGHRSRFDGIAERYSNFRPSYPDSLLASLTAAILAEPPKSGAVFDVGSGTGIFTRQLRERLPPEMTVVGVEPSADMRVKAEATGMPPDLDYIDGAAESLPIEDGTARAILAATAAHWFPRPAFYREARRALCPGGLLAIVEYVRDEERSALARDLVSFMARHGTTKAYDRPDYSAEFETLEGFTPLEHFVDPRTLELTFDQFIGLALSSSHARAVVANLGQAEAETGLRDLSERHRTREGHVGFGYLFQYFLVRRRAESRTRSP